MSGLGESSGTLDDWENDYAEEVGMSNKRLVPYRPMYGIVLSETKTARHHFDPGLSSVYLTSLIKWPLLLLTRETRSMLRKT